MDTDKHTSNKLVERLSYPGITRTMSDEKVFHSEIRKSLNYMQNRKYKGD